MKLQQEIENGLYYRWLPGPSGAPVIIWIHGLGESGLCFETIIRHPVLSKYSHWIADMPGYGRSIRTDRTFTLSELADDMANRIRHRFNAVILAGHSMGGVIGQIIAAKHPGCVKTFVNIEGNITEDDCAFSGKATSVSESEFIESEFYKMLDSIYKTGLDDPALRGYHKSLQLCDPNQFYRNSYELVQHSRTGNLAPDLAALTMPVIYFAGRPGGACLDSIRVLEESSIHYTIIEPSGHWPFIDQPDVFANKMNEFFTGLTCV